MAEEFDAVDRAKQVLGGPFWQNALQSMQNNMRKQLETQASPQKDAQPLGKVLEQTLNKKVGK